MVDTLLKSEPYLRGFFTEKENDSKVVNDDFKTLISAKLGSSVGVMFYSSLFSSSKALMPEEIFGDDEKLSKTSKEIAKLSTPKKAQTSDLLLSYLKENIDFIMLDKSGYEKMKKQLKVFINLLDSSSRLLFAQNITSATTEDGDSLLDYLFDIFEADLLEMLDMTEKTKKIIKGSK